MEPPTEPDLIGPWKKNVWLYGLRIPFSLVFVGWVTLAQSLSPSFNLELYLLLLLASTLGLIVGAHYIDIATSVEKFSPYFSIPVKKMLSIGVVSVLLGAATGIYIAFEWNLPLLYIFIAAEGFAAIAYPREKPKIAHSYTAFGLFWGSLPFIAAYYVQARTFSILAVGFCIFVGVSVVMMHHLAIMTRESSDWKNALYLLALYRYSVYAVGLISLLSSLLTL